MEGRNLREMRGIWFVVGSCVAGLVLAGCGASLGPKDEGLELLPSAVQSDPPSAEPSTSSPEDAPGEFPVLVEEELDTGAEADTSEVVESEPLANPFVEAARRLERARSVRIATTISSELPNGAVAMIRTDGTFVTATNLGSVNVDSPNLIRNLGTQGPSAVPFVPVELVFGEKTIYLNYEELPEVVLGQQPWAVASFRQLIGLTQWPDEGSISAVALTTPAHVAAFLTASRKTLVEVGPDPVRGASATHYRALVDLAKVPAAALETTRGAMRVQMRALTAALGTSQLPIDVWLDAKGRLRRVQFDLAAVLPTAVEESPAADSGAASEQPESEPALDGPAEPAPAATESPEEETPPSPDDGTPLNPDESADLGAADGGVAGAERVLEGQTAISPPGRPQALIVVDFIAFSGRVRAFPRPPRMSPLHTNRSPRSREVSAPRWPASPCARDLGATGSRRPGSA